MLIVEKFGGSSVADAERIRCAARIIEKTRVEGNELVVVLSAQGDTTDKLLEKAREIAPEASGRELDALLSVGEQISVSLMAMQLERMGLPAISLTGWQAGIVTDSAFGEARIKAISARRIRRELNKNKVVIIAGFQGVNSRGEITTLGRGGSDTTAVALAAALNADKCRIYTDVEGVFTADPRRVPSARKYEAISYDDMLELSLLGSQVMHSRSVELAKRCGVELEVLSSYVDRPGTIIGESGEDGDAVPAAVGITADRNGWNTAKVSIVGRGLRGPSGAEEMMLSALKEADIEARPLHTGEMSFSVLVPKKETDRALRAIHSKIFET